MGFRLDCRIVSASLVLALHAVYPCIAWIKFNTYLRSMYYLEAGDNSFTRFFRKFVLNISLKITFDFSTDYFRQQYLRAYLSQLREQGNPTSFNDLSY